MAIVKLRKPRLYAPQLMSLIQSTISALIHSAFVWDNHACMPLRADDTFLPQLQRYRRAGVTLVSLNVGFADIDWTAQVRVLSYMRRWLSLHPNEYQLVSTVVDARQCKENGKLGIVFDIEGMNPVQANLPLVQTFYELGVRWMLVAYNRNNAAGGGCLDADGGLTALGRSIIDEMERVGMVLCLSHSGLRTVQDALDYARNPPIFSHSNPQGDTPHPRNITDNLMRTCAHKGGVVGLSGIGPFLGGNSNVVQHLLRQLRYTIDLIGPQHVGLGLDYVFDRSELESCVRQNPSLFSTDMSVNGRIGMVEPEDLHEIVEGLARDNLSDDQILDILGRNWLRIAEQVWMS